MKRISAKAVVLVILAVGFVFLLLFLINFRNGKNSWEAQFDLGNKYLLSQNYEQAIICFSQAIKIEPRRYEAYLALAEIYEQLGDKNKADQLRREGYDQTGDVHLKPVCVHDWAPANYQEPQICVLCGETKGSPLPAALATKTMMVGGEPYTYITQCTEDTAKQTAAKVVITESEDLISDEMHPEKEDYTWKRISVTVTAEDENAWKYGIRIRLDVLDYYTGDSFNLQLSEESSPEGFSVDYRGKKYECTAFTHEVEAGWNGKIFTWNTQYDFQVPEGYDGCVPILFNASHLDDLNASQEEVTNLLLNDENTLYFNIK